VRNFHITEDIGAHLIGNSGPPVLAAARQSVASGDADDPVRGRDRGGALGVVAINR
jgi:hypothetical protein